MGAVGTFALGTEAVGSTTAHALPVVVISAPVGTVTTGGPALTVAWDTTQAQGDAQAQFRVTFTNDAGTTTYYDSGWLSGATESLVVNLVDQGVPTDSTDVTVKVEARSVAGSSVWLGSDSEALAMQWGVVSLVVTNPSPDESFSTSSITPTWTFSSTRSKTQGHLRVRIMQGGVVIHDSGWVASDDDEYAVSSVLGDGTYQCEIDVKNSEGVLAS